jgi:hypothetical protein
VRAVLAVGDGNAGVSPVILWSAEGAEMSITNTRPYARTDEVSALAASLGVHVARYRARSGTPAKFRFFTEPSDFHAGDGLGTVIGPRNALTWLRGFQAAKTLCFEIEEAR